MIIDDYCNIKKYNTHRIILHTSYQAFRVFFSVLSSTTSHTADDDSFAGEAIEAGLDVVRLPAGFNQKGQQTGSSESEFFTVSPKIRGKYQQESGIKWFI
jgi:hypothetical protein